MNSILTKKYYGTVYYFQTKPDRIDIYIQGPDYLLPVLQLWAFIEADRLVDVEKIIFNEIFESWTCFNRQIRNISVGSQVKVKKKKKRGDKDKPWYTRFL